MQFIVITEQLWITLYAAVFGCLYAAVYDVLRILRMLVGATPVTGKGEIKALSRLPSYKIKGSGFFRGLSNGIRDLLFIQIADILYGLFFAVSFCIFLFYFNSGRFRWYLLLAAFIGYIAYYFSVGKLIVYLSSYIIALLKTLFSFIFYLIMIPIRFIIKLTKKLFSPVINAASYKIAVIKTEKDKKNLIRLATFK